MKDGIFLVMARRDSHDLDLGHFKKGQIYSVVGVRLTKDNTYFEIWNGKYFDRVHASNFILIERAQ